MVETKNLLSTKSSQKTTLIVEVVLPVPLSSSFDYIINENNFINTGARVLVPFGRRKLIGFITKLKKKSNYPHNKLKPVLKVLDKTPLINEEHLKLISWASYYYKHPFGLAIEAATPTWLRKDNPIDSLIESIQKENQELQSSKPILNSTNIQLTLEQANAIGTIIKDIEKFKVHSLYGVTGSGKTEVYFQVIAKVLKNNKQALVLIPEITLTPQTLSRFKARFNVPIALLHSQVSEKQKAKNWLMAKLGVAKIIIGTRSASLVPIKNTGVIIIDEEHDGSFKQQDNFKYSAKDFLIKRASDLGVPIILGSASPSLETIANVYRNKFELIKLENRVNNYQVPKIKLIDTRHKKLVSGLSMHLIELIKKHLANNGQVILFLNRRGYAPVLYCNGCGWIAECKNCDSKLIVHLKKSFITCHHCNMRTNIPKVCPECGVDDLAPLGQGTEKIEKTLNQYFPHKKIARIDKDTITKKNSMQNIIKAIDNREIDIIVGTQIIAKGHHFENISLVGILDVDAAFYSSDFRAIEKTGQLITQVAGRAGRTGNAAEVVLQTDRVEDLTLKTLIEKNYLDFANLLLQDRSSTNLPPYSFQALIRSESKDIDMALKFLHFIRKNISSAAELTTLGPIPAVMIKKKNTHRALMLLQSSSRSIIHKEIDSIIDITSKQKEVSFNKVKWSIDIDPQDIY